MNRNTSIQSVMVVAGAATFSTRDVWQGYCDGLRQVGLDVIPYPTFSMLRVLSEELVCNDIIAKALDARHRVDVVVVVDGLFFRGRRVWVLETLRKAGIPTALVATDDPYEKIPGADHLFSLATTNEVRCATAQIPYLPTATREPTTIGDGEIIYDVVFIGTIFGDRWPLLYQLAEYCGGKRLRLLIAGNPLVDLSEQPGYDTVELRAETVPAAAKWRQYSQARVVLNLFRDCSEPADAPNPRVFETAALGGPALLTGRTRAEVTRIFGESVYQFDDFAGLCEQLHRALDDEPQRRQRVARARQIARAGHLYVHRASQLTELLNGRLCTVGEARFPREEKLCWIFGCARTGSTWLLEMLRDLQGVWTWDEPHFGKLFLHLAQHDEEWTRSSSFYFSRFSQTLFGGVRNLFYAMASQRFHAAHDSEALFIKETNAGECCPFLRELFPQSKFLLLVRDPFDILDSFLDMQRPGGWNEGFAGEAKTVPEQARTSAMSIRSSLCRAIDAYNDFPEQQRLRVRYEDMLADAAACLQRCAARAGLNVDSEVAEAIADDHRFERYSDTGMLRPRRFGKSELWRSSPNFSDSVRAMAEEILGGVRGLLGYAA